jgi:hypothetical protein
MLTQTMTQITTQLGVPRERLDVATHSMPYRV